MKTGKWIISNFQIFIQFPPGPPAGCSTWGLCSRPWSPREVGAFCSPCYHLWHGFTFLLVPVFILSTVRRDDIYHIWGFKRWYEVSKILFPKQLRRIRPLSVPEQRPQVSTFLSFHFSVKREKGKTHNRHHSLLLQGGSTFSQVQQDSSVGGRRDMYLTPWGSRQIGKSGPPLIWRQIGPHTFWCCGKLGPGKSGPSKLGLWCGKLGWKKCWIMEYNSNAV